MRSSCHPPFKTNMQVKAGIELPRRVSCSSASSDTEAHSDCQRRPNTACIRVSQGGRDGLATTDLLKLKRGQDFRPRGRLKNPSPASRSRSLRSAVVPHARRPLQTAPKRFQNGHSAGARDSKSDYGILSPLNTSVAGLIIRGIMHRLADVRRVIGNCNTESLKRIFQRISCNCHHSSLPACRRRRRP